MGTDKKIIEITDTEHLTSEQTRCINDLLRNARTIGLNYSERGFRQKLIDLLYNLDYYKYNKTIFFKDE